MTYIINPFYFYIINVLSSLDIIMTFALFAAGIASVILGFWYLSLTYSEDDDCEYVQKDRARVKRYFIRVLSLTFAIALVSALLPNRETLYQILVAKYATTENAQWSVDAIKSVVDYIVQSIKSLR